MSQNRGVQRSEAGNDVSGHLASPSARTGEATVTNRRRPLTILIAEDDVEDQMLLEEAFGESQWVTDLRFVEDGEQLLDYLHQRGRYADPGVAPRPGVILLDLNMPRKDGREALQEIKADPTLRQIPIIVLTTSRAEEDIFRSYDLGVNSFI